MSRPIPDHADVPAVHRTAGAPRSRREFLRSAFQQSTRQVEAPPRLQKQQKDGFTGQRYAFATVAPPLAWGDNRLRLLRRATYGLTPNDIADVESRGYQQWLTNQLNYTRIDDSAVDTVVAARYPLLSLPVSQLIVANGGTVQTQLQEMTIYRAAFSRRQLYERMVEFWTDHFNIYMPKVGNLLAIDIREVIRRHALGRFSDLLFASAHSPAMLAYLDQNTSTRGNPNQNYARELMELHTLGVDGGYTQTDVDELARVLTGWSINNAGEFVFLPNRHDYGQKVVLGVTIPASAQAGSGTAAQQEGEQMLTFLVNHPSTSRFIGRKLLQWFITPEPTNTQIEAVAGVFRATRGDIKLTVRAVLNSGWVGQAPAKLKRPFHLAVSALRATAPTVSALGTMNTQVRLNGQPLFQYETPDGYPDLVEFWSGNLLPRWNMGTTLSTQANNATINLDVAPYMGGTTAAAIDKIQADFFGDELALTTRTALLNYLNGGTFNPARVRETIALALSSADFQWY